MTHTTLSGLFLICAFYVHQLVFNVEHFHNRQKYNFTYECHISVIRVKAFNVKFEIFYPRVRLLHMHSGFPRATYLLVVRRFLSLRPSLFFFARGDTDTFGESSNSARLYLVATTSGCDGTKILERTCNDDS
mmetsp:Transcript_4239/g.8587  ORF Transcript_4239/g.8587 Transcript_4239/m.8587 type:complete len:132 (+) Transcript_4239:67-462(+)